MHVRRGGDLRCGDRGRGVDLFALLSDQFCFGRRGHLGIAAELGFYQKTELGEDLLVYTGFSYRIGRIDHSELQSFYLFHLLGGI